MPELQYRSIACSGVYDTTTNQRFFGIDLATDENREKIQSRNQQIEDYLQGKIKDLPDD